MEDKTDLPPYNLVKSAVIMLGYNGITEYCKENGISYPFLQNQWNLIPEKRNLEMVKQAWNIFNLGDKAWKKHIVQKAS